MTSEQDRSRANAEINANLRRAYEEVTQQEIPERFKELLDRLRDGSAPEKAKPQGAAPEEKDAGSTSADKGDGDG